MLYSLSPCEWLYTMYRWLSSNGQSQWPLEQLGGTSGIVRITDEAYTYAVTRFMMYEHCGTLLYCNEIFPRIRVFLPHM